MMFLHFEIPIPKLAKKFHHENKIKVESVQLGRPLNEPIFVKQKAIARNNGVQVHWCEQIWSCYVV